MSEIKFGTDGWRAIIAEEYTFANVRRVSRAYARYLLEHAPGTPEAPTRVAVGYDTRFQSEHFARATAEVLAAAGIDVHLATAPSPTPAISWAVKHLGLPGAVVITSSHNPARYSGFKIKSACAGSADPAITGYVERAAAEDAPLPPAARQGEIRDYDPRPPYFDQLLKLVDVERIRTSSLHLICDPLFGAGQGYVPRFLHLPDGRVDELHGWRDAFFGGLNPEPIPPHVDELCRTVAADPHPNRLGLAFDGDADRLGVVDDRGRFIECQKVLAMLVDYLAGLKGWRGEVVKTFSVGRQVDRVCEARGLTLHETAIGFKYVVDLMLARDILIGGEESGGVGIKGHIPERDGSLSGLLVAEMVARAARPLSQLVEEFDEKYGRFIYNRVDMHAHGARDLVGRLAAAVPRELAGVAVREHATKDGLKLLFEDGSWLLLRGSGTEPMLRVYAEAGHEDQVRRLLEAGRAWAAAETSRSGAPQEASGAR